MEDTSLAKRDYDITLDNYLTEVCLDRTMGDVVRSREKAANAKEYTVACMVFNAVFELDVDLIRTIATRIDGTIPVEGKREDFANIIGDALEDVLGYDKKEQAVITPEDSPVIAMAKALVHIGTQPCGKNFAKRKERNLAAQMILERTGGRKVNPTRPLIETKYVEPEWMRLEEANGKDAGREG